MLMVCKDAGGSVQFRVSIEELMIRFFHESFRSGRVYVVSPWVTAFNLSIKFIHMPYVNNNNVAEVLRALVNKGVEVRVLTRCVDESLDVQFMRVLINLHRRGGLKLPDEVRELFRRNIEDFINRAESLVRLASDLGDNLRFDLGDKDDLFAMYRLHSKLYINDYSVIMGSANFTRGGVLDGGNWECVIRFARGENEELYRYALNVAEHYFNISRGFGDCERRVVRIVNTVVGSLDEPIYGIEDLIDYLGRVRESL